MFGYNWFGMTIKVEVTKGRSKQLRAISEKLDTVAYELEVLRHAVDGLLEHPVQERIDALAAELNSSTDGLATALKKHRRVTHHGGN